MLTFSPIKNGSGYAARHLSYSDYVDENAKVTGQWMGKMAEQLGLSGEVSIDQFEALRTGCHPETGERLRPRIREDGINLYDFTLSAPKSLSMLAINEGDTRLLGAHDRAVARSMAELETLAATRVRLDGLNENRQTGNLAIAVYRHDTSRDLDAQVHSHCVVPNVTYDPVEKRHKALKARPMCEAANYATEVYRNELAHEMMILGYELETIYDEHGRDAGFEVKKVEKPLRDKQSSRSATRDALIAEFQKREGRNPTKKEVAVLIRTSRKDKLPEISTADLRALQRERIGEDGRNTLHQVHREALERGPREESSPALESLEYAKAHLFARRSVFAEHEILTEALRHGRGRIRLGELKAVMQSQISSGELIGSRGDFATLQTLERERAIVGSVNRGIGQYEKLGGEGRRFQPAAEAKLNEEQARAVSGILNSRDGVVCLQGAAGTGKTRTLGELRRGIMEAGREVYGVAPTQSAVDEMKKDGVEGSVTISNLLVNQAAQEKLRGEVLFLDESGMIGGDDMASLLQLREKLGFRMVLIGDTKQIQAVMATDSLRIMQKESRLKTFELADIQRQKGAYKKAISTLRKDPAQGLSQLMDMGAVHEVPILDRAEAAVAAYRNEVSKSGKDGKQHSVLVVCPTWNEIDKFTAAIREHRKAMGELAEGREFERLQPLNWTDAQKGEARNFKAGQKLLFHKGTAHIRKGSVLNVLRGEDGKVYCESPDGKGHVLTQKQAGCFGVFDAEKIDVRVGDRLMLQENRSWFSGCKTVNGEFVSVSKIDKKGRMHITDDAGKERVLPADYFQFTHGYACTSHRSQGKTVASVIVIGDRFTKETFYVAASRGRESVTIITSDKEQLRETIGVSGERRSAIDVVRASKHDKARAGFGRKPPGWARAGEWAANQARAWHKKLVGLGKDGHERHPHTSEVFRDRGDRSLAKEK